MGKQRQTQDHYFREAKRLGYVSRAAFKLLEIDEKQGILAKGSRVLDVGCAPGAWLQVAAERVGKKGRIVGIDLKRVGVSLPSNVQTVQGDVFETDVADLTGMAGGLFDVVISDAAPDTTGDPTGDHFRSIRLCDHILTILPALLLPGGPVVMKAFEGESYPDLLARMRTMFAKVKGVKPKASRSISREMFVVGLTFDPGA
ncbi:MAG: RlmE family RNA methyltransferase [Phycisphaerales bacterium]|nr:RlmE family RNA methyltransferase [Phycisphaerales bacterium]